MSYYEKEQQRLLVLWQQVEEEEENYELSDVESEEEEDHLSETVDKSDTEQETEDEAELAENVEEAEDGEEIRNQKTIDSKKYYTGKDGVTKWYKTMSTNRVRTRVENIITHLPCVKPYGKNARSIMDCWSLFIDDVMITDIVKCTNMKIREKAATFRVKQYYLGETNVTELKAVLGLLYLAGVFKSNHQNLNDLWMTDGTGIDIFRSTMCLKRFTFLLSCLRFDNIENRMERLKYDKMAHIRAIFERFVDNCGQAYSPSEYLTLDEKLESFRGKCSFRQFIPNKPSKYGLKVQALVDSRSFYVVKLEVYVGKQPEGPFQVSNRPEDIVMRMVEPISGTNRNVTFDNWYTSYNVMTRLLNEHKLTSVGTIRKNKRFIPPNFLNTKSRELNSSLFGFQKDMTLVSYVPRKNKNVLLTSTLHHDDKIDEDTGDRKLPEIISFYNFTKAGVDVVDELSASYNVARNSRRWPLTLFFSLMNTAGINSQVIYRQNNSDFKMKRREYIRKLGLTLVSAYMNERKANPRISTELRGKIKMISEATPESKPIVKRQKTVGRCQVCPRTRDRKTKYTCSVCDNFLCLEHAVMRCQNCTVSDEV